MNGGESISVRRRRKFGKPLQSTGSVKIAEFVLNGCERGVHYSGTQRW